GGGRAREAMLHEASAVFLQKQRDGVPDARRLPASSSTTDRVPRAQDLGIIARIYRREVERALKALSDHVDRVRRGTSCDQHRGLILAYVPGVAGPHRVQVARRHLATCPGCAAWAGRLRGPPTTPATTAGSSPSVTPSAGTAITSRAWSCGPTRRRAAAR